jgi:hypothetical protein
MRRRSSGLVRLLAIAVLSVIASLLARPTAQSAQLEQALFKPKLLDPTAELVNPMRGLFRWNEQEVAPQPRPSFDSYKRYSWDSFEPAPGVYDFSLLEKDLETARRAGRKHSFRIRSMVLGNGMDLPKHVASRLERGWWGRDTYVPDWNDPDYLAAVEAFVNELARRYDGDPRISYVEIGAYGTWGEWNTYPFTGEYPVSSGAEQLTTENAYRLVDAYVNAFTRTPLTMLSDHKPALVYALKRSPTMGWRRDSLGVPHFTEGMERLKEDPEAWALVMERWKTAPVIAEFINPGGVEAPEVYELSLKQAREYHVAMLGNGNTLDWDSLNTTSKNLYLQLGRSLGYRYELNQLQLPARLAPGSRFEVSASWRNAGIAPTYENWDVMLQLRPAGSKDVAWEGRLNVELRTLLPSGKATLNDELDASVSATDAELAASTSSLRINKPLAPGSYDLHILVRDPQAYREPLALAIEGRTGDGSYRLGQVTVVEGSGLDSLLEPQVYLPLVGR